MMKSSIKLLRLSIALLLSVGWTHISCAQTIKVKNLDVKNLKVKNKAQFCGDVSIKGDLTVDGEVIEKRDAFYGWWRLLSKGAPHDSFIPQLIFFDTRDENNIQTRSYGGTLWNTFEYETPTDIDLLPKIKQNERVISVIDDGSVTSTVEGITGTYPDIFTYDFTIQQGGEFDGLVFLGYDSVARNEELSGSTEGFLYEKLNFEPAVGDQIRPYGNGDNAFTNVNSRRFMFEQVDDIIFKANTPALSPRGLADRLLPRQERLALFEQIMNEGVDRDSIALYSIYKTTKNSGTTTLFTKGVYPFVRGASRVTISGLSGVWGERLNGEQQVVGILNTDDHTIDTQAPFFLPETNLYSFVIDVDTSDLPPFDASRDVCSDGALITPSRIGPITEDIEHQEWVDAVLYYTTKVFQQSVHSRPEAYFDAIGNDFFASVDSSFTKPVLPTWDEVSQALLGNRAAQQLAIRSKDNNGREAADFCLPGRISFTQTQINSPFEELGIPGSTLDPGIFPEYTVGPLPVLDYNIPTFNYLDPSSLRWLYFRVKPDTPIANTQQENVWVLAYDENGNLIPELRGYASVGPQGLNSGEQLGGSRLEGLLSPVPWGESDPSIEDGFWSPYTYDVPLPVFFNVGIVRPELVDGRKIGYMTFAYNLLFDPYFIGLNANFGDPAAGPKRQQFDGETAVVSEIMKYLNEQGVEAVIIDNRINEGFFNTASLIESFGGPRKGITDLHAFQNQDNRDAFNVDSEIEVWSGTTLEDRTIRKLIDTAPWPEVRPDLREQQYPGTVFKNGPVIILDAVSAGSGGDQFPRFFSGDNLDGDIGNGVTTKIVGNINGILDGYQPGAIPLITSRYGSEFNEDQGGELVGVSPYLVGAEALLYNNIGGVPTITRLNPTTGDPIEALVPVNSNLQGPIFSPENTGTLEIRQGALSRNLEDTVYFDFGYRGAGTAVDGTPYAPGHWDNPPTGITQVDGFPGQPVPTDPTTLRDSWFEEALRVTRLCLGEELVAGKSIGTSEEMGPKKHAYKLPSASDMSMKYVMMRRGLKERLEQKFRNRAGKKSTT